MGEGGVQQRAATAEGNTKIFHCLHLNVVLVICFVVAVCLFLVLSIVDDVIVAVHTLERVFTICTYLIGFTKATPALEKPQRNYNINENNSHAPLCPSCNPAHCELYTF